MTPKELLDTILGYLGFVVQIDETQSEGGNPTLQIYMEESHTLIGRGGHSRDRAERERRGPVPDPQKVTAVVEITLNGAPMRLPSGASVADLLALLQVTTPRVAVERNREIVPKARYPDTTLVAGDVLEVVELVGGG